MQWPKEKKWTHNDLQNTLVTHIVLSGKYLVGDRKKEKL